MAVLVNVSLVIASGALIFSENCNDTLVYIQGVLTFMTIFLMFYVACKDPGIINPKTWTEERGSEQLIRDHNSIDDAETHF